MHAIRRTGPRGFTLVELLIVITIIALISAVALPVVLPALNERRVNEAARLLQATLAGSRDAAIRANAPRGIRLLPDPVFDGTNGVLASNRFIAIEPGPDYSEGQAILETANTASTSGANYYNHLYSFYNNQNVNHYYGVNVTFTHAIPGQYLMICELDYTSFPVPSNPTNWSLNIRQGDKIRFNDSGAYYTIAGPINGPPFSVTVPNNERVVSGLQSSTASLPTQTGWSPEFLFLLNGQDDNGNGWIDESCDGIDNDGDGVIDPGFNGIDDDGVNGVDDPNEMMWGLNLGTPAGRYSGTEFEQEVFLGFEASLMGQSGSTPLGYTIVRRPVVSPNAREVTLPAGVVIDLTGWNFASLGAGLLPERSRLPVDPATGFVDIIIDQTGRVVSQSVGNPGSGSNSPLSSLPFYHFWLAEREDAQPPANPLPTPVINPLLPMPKSTPSYTPLAGAAKPYLTGERRLVTLFVKTGQIVTTSLPDSTYNPNDPTHPSGAFNVLDASYPYYNAQAGIKEPL